MIIEREILHGHVFCGIGGGAEGFDDGAARVGNLIARFKCVGGIDVDPAACRDFTRRLGVPATCRDLFTREQYAAFHGCEPPGDFVEAVPADVVRAFGGKRPHIIFLSAPCKGFSGLLSERASRSAKYQALNGLTLRGPWLALEAFKDDPVELIIFENVPRIATRGRYLLDQITALFRAYGYAVAETAHDCGELGHLAQSRKRFLLVARHAAKVPNFLYEPIRRPLRGVGEVIGALPVPFPGSELWNAMHRMPALHWKTWVRLAFVEAGSDWRSLNKLAVENGMLRDFGIAPDYGFNGMMGVVPWSKPSGVVASESRPSNGSFSVADPRIDGHARSVQLGVRQWGQHAGVVTGKMFAGGGPHAVADPRIEGRPRFNNTYRIVRWPETAPAVAGPGGPAGGLAVADPRPAYGPGRHRNVLRITPWGAHAGTGNDHVTGGALCVADPRAGFERGGKGKYRVTGFEEHAGAVIGASTTGQGAFAVADPRPRCLNDAARDAYLTGGHYGVVRWDEHAGAVPGHAKNNNGRWSVADARVPGAAQHASLHDALQTRDPGAELAALGPGSRAEDGAWPGHVSLPAADDRLVAVIRALDGTWHRPFTTLELAALQGLVDPEEQFELDGLSDSAWRERIGNCVPPPSAKAIAGVMGRALLLAWSGETSALATEPVWVRPVAAALMAAQVAP